MSYERCLQTRRSYLEPVFMGTYKPKQDYEEKRWKEGTREQPKNEIFLDRTFSTGRTLVGPSRTSYIVNSYSFVVGTSDVCEHITVVYFDLRTKVSPPCVIGLSFYRTLFGPIV